MKSLIIKTFNSKSPPLQTAQGWGTLDGDAVEKTKPSFSGELRCKGGPPAPMIFRWPAKKRIPWLLGALALMFASAYSILRLFGIAGAVSGWIGLPQYAAQIPELEAEASWWNVLAVIFPFLAAFLLGFGGDEVDSSTESRGRLSPIASYLLRLLVSGIGTLGFIVLLLLALFVLYELGIHTG